MKQEYRACICKKWQTCSSICAYAALLVRDTLRVALLARRSMEGKIAPALPRDLRSCSSLLLLRMSSSKLLYRSSARMSGQESQRLGFVALAVVTLADFCLPCCFRGALGSVTSSSPSVSDSNDFSENRLDIFLQSSFKDFRKERRPDSLLVIKSLSSEDGDCGAASEISDAAAANGTMSLSSDLTSAKEMDSLR